jgi:hypothetical protein
MVRIGVLIDYFKDLDRDKTLILDLDAKLFDGVYKFNEHNRRIDFKERSCWVLLE